MTETICKLVCSAFYLSEDTFDAVPIPVYFLLESEPVAVERSLQSRRFIDEKDSVNHEMFLAEFGKEHLGHALCSRRRLPDVEQAVRVDVDRRVQPVSLTIELVTVSLTAT